MRRNSNRPKGVMTAYVVCFNRDLVVRMDEVNFTEDCSTVQCGSEIVDVGVG